MVQLYIYLCCGGGLSSGFLAQKARAAARESGVNATIEVKGESEVTQYLPRIDILCIGPHYKSRLKVFESMVAPHNILVVVIPEEIYFMLGGKALLRPIVDTLEKYRV